MEGSERDNFDRLMVELEASPEHVLIQALETFDTTHREYLESAVLFARNRMNPVASTLMDANGGRLISDFLSCLDVIESVEESLDEQAGLIGWLLWHEYEKRVGFINFYEHTTGLALADQPDEDSYESAQQLLRASDPRTSILKHWQSSLRADITKFIRYYK